MVVEVTYHHKWKVSSGVELGALFGTGWLMALPLTDPWLPVDSDQVMDAGEGETTRGVIGQNRLEVEGEWSGVD